MKSVAQGEETEPRLQETRLEREKKGETTEKERERDRGSEESLVPLTRHIVHWHHSHTILHLLFLTLLPNYDFQLAQ